MQIALSLPLVGRVAAGSPILAQEHIEASYAIDPNLFDDKPDYLLKVRGMSMRDAGILDGDLLAVRRADEARNGQVVVARVGDDVTVKRWRRKGHTIELLPENPDFEPIVVDSRSDAFALEGIARPAARRWQGRQRVPGLRRGLARQPPAMPALPRCPAAFRPRHRAARRRLAVGMLTELIGRDRASANCACWRCCASSPRTPLRRAAGAALLPYAALASHGIDLDYLLVVRAPNAADRLWAVEQTLRAPPRRPARLVAAGAPALSTCDACSPAAQPAAGRCSCSGPWRRVQASPAPLRLFCPAR